METKATNEALSESAKLTEKWFKDANDAMTDIYNKQVNLALGLYNNWSNAWLGASNTSPQNNFNSFFSGPDLSKWNFFNGFNPAGAYSAWLDRIWKQALNYNQEMIAFFNEATNSNTANWEEVIKQYRAMLEKRFEITSATISTAADSYRKQMGTSFDGYKKIAEQTNKQLAELIKQNENFWAEAMKAFNHDGKQEKTKDLTPVDTRKKANVFAA